MREFTPPVGRIAGMRTRRRVDVVLLALLTALASLALVLPGLSAPARADVNAGIKVTDLTLTKSDKTGADLEGPVKVKDIAKLSFTWDATGANPTSGDSFSIGLGDYFTNLVEPQTASMAVTYNGQVTEVGTCTLDKTTATCTFNNKIDELKAAGFTSFKGTTSALLLVIGQTTSETTQMTVNGNAVDVDLPGTGGIRPHDPVEWHMSKVGSVIGENSRNIYWEIDFGADYIAKQLEGVTVDGQTNSTIVFTDTLGTGSTFVTDPASWQLQYWGQANGDFPDKGLTLADGNGVVDGSQGKFTVAPAIEGNTATISVTGPFKPGANYRIYYQSAFTSETGTAKPDTIYGNKVSIPNGEEASNSQTYTSTFNVSVEMAAGFGGFNVLKQADGDAANKVPTGTAFDVTVNYVLPEKASTYTGWQAPGTLNPDNKTGSTTMKVELGKAVAYPGTFPVGTKITLSEDPASASPAAEGYTWGEPVFTVGGEQDKEKTDTFTVENQKATAVTLTNTATLTPVPPNPEPNPNPNPNPHPNPNPAVPSPTTSSPSPAASNPNPAASSPSPKPGNSLASTGASVLVPLLVAGGALLGGGALMLRRRRSTRA